MLKIAICDDEKVYIDLIYNYLSDILKDTTLDVQISKYKSSQLLLENHLKNAFDILFLDIDMPTLSGFDVSSKIRIDSSNTYIVFISAKHELVYSSFDYNPFYFICKTNENNLYVELKHVVNKLLTHYQQHRTVYINDTIHGLTPVSVQNIIYIKSNKHYLQYFLSNHSMQLFERGSLNTVQESLNCPDLIKVHQRYLVNMNHIIRFGTFSNTIILDNNQEIPVSKSQRLPALEAYMIYKRR